MKQSKRYSPEIREKVTFIDDNRIGFAFPDRIALIVIASQVRRAGLSDIVVLQVALTPHLFFSILS